MQLGWSDHFEHIVIPAWQAYLHAESELSEAAAGERDDRYETVHYTTLRQAGAAVFYLHHFADIVGNERPDCLPDEVQTLREIYSWVETKCVMLRTAEPVCDISLLGDVADALKHARLTRRVEDRDVAERDAVLLVGSGFGELRYGEGKFGGAEQVIILAKSGKRALSSVLQNGIDAWKTALGWELTEIGEP